MIDEHCDIAALGRSTTRIISVEGNLSNALRAGSSLTMTEYSLGVCLLSRRSRRKRSATSMCSLFRTRETFSSCAPTNTPFSR